MRRTWFRSLVLISAACFGEISGHAATNPRYGGILRVELPTVSVSLDPRTWRAGSLEAAEDEKLATLIFERLVIFDNYGRVQPALATEWSHDGFEKRWQFTLRSGVKFSDGSLLTVSDVVAALEPLLPESLQISAGANTVVIQSAQPIPDVLEQLASGRYLVYRASPGGLVGTGPFVMAENHAEAGQASHLILHASEEAWSGRPFVDAIDVALGVPPLRALFDLQLGKADLVELAPDLVSRATQANLRVWSTDPLVLYALRFEDGAGTRGDVRLREAMSLAIDRETMANVLLQKQAHPAAALLPQWLSGYAFLFNVDANLEHAKELRRSSAANAAGNGEPLHLRIDPAGDLPKLLGQRVAINARQAAILVQVVSHAPQRGGTSTPTPPAEGSSDAHLFVWRYSSLSPHAELDSLLTAYKLTEPPEMNGMGTESEKLYARERRVLESWRVLPLVEQAESVALSANLRNWAPSRWGEWHLADVWLDNRESAEKVAPNSGKVKTNRASANNTSPGAKP